MHSQSDMHNCSLQLSQLRNDSPLNIPTLPLDNARRALPWWHASCVGVVLQALEYQMQQGMAEGAKQQVFLMPRSAAHTYGPPLQSACCLLRLLQASSD